MEGWRGGARVRASVLSMFDLAIWATVFPDLFSWGDGVPFPKRHGSYRLRARFVDRAFASRCCLRTRTSASRRCEKPVQASEVFQYSLLREELAHSLENDMEEFLPPPKPHALNPSPKPWGHQPYAPNPTGPTGPRKPQTLCPKPSGP